MHSYFGPALLTKRGDVRANQQAPRIFWHAVSQWERQGKRVDDHGRCIWEEEPEPKTIHVGGRHYVIVDEKGDARNDHRRMARGSQHPTRNV